MAVVSGVCPRWEGTLALAAVGGLGRVEGLWLRAHLRRCPGCALELERLRLTVARLPQLPPEPLLDDQAPPVLARRRGGRGAAPAGALLAGVAVAVVLLLQSAGSSGLALAGSRGVVADGQLTSESWGTELALQVDGQRAGERFSVSMRSVYGGIWQVGSYRATSDSLTVHFSCALPEGQVSQLLVTDPAGRVVLSAAVR